jgi:hypothetical protein
MVQGTDISPKYSFDEFKLYYDSTEKVTDRRLATNTWNYGLCTAIMLAIAGLAGWASARLDFRLVMLLAMLILAGIGALLCLLWARQIRDFKELNAAKFEVLNAMAPSIRFGSDDTVVSAQPFEREWQILKAREAAREVNAMNIVALRSSNAELLVPVAFRWLFYLIITATVVIIVFNWQTLTKTVFGLNQPVTPPASTATVPGKP